MRTEAKLSGGQRVIVSLIAVLHRLFSMQIAKAKSKAAAAEEKLKSAESDRSKSDALVKQVAAERDQARATVVELDSKWRHCDKQWLAWEQTATVAKKDAATFQQRLKDLHQATVFVRNASAMELDEAIKAKFRCRVVYGNHIVVCCGATETGRVFLNWIVTPGPTWRDSFRVICNLDGQTVVNEPALSGTLPLQLAPDQTYSFAFYVEGRLEKIYRTGWMDYNLLLTVSIPGPETMERSPGHDSDSCIAEVQRKIELRSNLEQLRDREIKQAREKGLSPEAEARVIEFIQSAIHRAMDDLG
ncbi:MAG: hypothetical protein QM770_14490 [Tepidisphaeraceae bacterium]